MSLLAMAIPRRVKATTPDGAQRLQTASICASHDRDHPDHDEPAKVDDAEFEKAKNDNSALATAVWG